MFYVYIIQAINYPDQRYIGRTGNLEKRLSDHNCGNSTHTKKYKPWKLVAYIAFENEFKSIEFEQYLKSGTGRAFLSKRLL
jgi:predicted GIY-YIG superfamily endonuclease